MCIRLPPLSALLKDALKDVPAGSFPALGGSKEQEDMSPVLRIEADNAANDSTSPRSMNMNQLAATTASGCPSTVTGVVGEKENNTRGDKNDAVTLFPRRKAGQAPQEGSQGPVVLSVQLLQKFYGMPLHLAAKKLVQTHLGL